MIVEGSDDRHCVIGLMEAHVDWPKEENRWPVYVHMGNGADEILSDGFLQTYLKQNVMKTFGIILDGDDKPSGRYAKTRNICLPMFPQIPEVLPPEGAITENADGKRLGIWIMPDNSKIGTIESFLKCLVPDESMALWHFAEKCVNDANASGAPFSDKDMEKACLYTWLAWQDPPDQTLGIALKKKLLNPHCEITVPFVEWFKKLYDLPAKSLLIT